MLDLNECLPNDYDFQDIELPSSHDTKRQLPKVKEELLQLDDDQQQILQHDEERPNEDEVHPFNQAQLQQHFEDFNHKRQELPREENLEQETPHQHQQQRPQRQRDQPELQEQEKLMSQRTVLPLDEASDLKGTS